MTTSMGGFADFMSSLVWRSLVVLELLTLSPALVFYAFIIFGRFLFKSLVSVILINRTSTVDLVGAELIEFPTIGTSL